MMNGQLTHGCACPLLCVENAPPVRYVLSLKRTPSVFQQRTGRIARSVSTHSRQHVQTCAAAGGGSGSSSAGAAAGSAAKSVTSAATRNQEASAPAVQAASHHGQTLDHVPAPGSNPVRDYLDNNKAARVGLYAGAVLLAGTLVLAAFRVFRKYNTPQNKRKRNVNKNKLIVETLAEYLPANRAALTPSVLRGLKMKTGFNSAEMFRKYLWYLLRERKFDTEAVNDIVQLKSALQLSDEEVSEAIKERAKRIYDKYGNVMLEVKGMTKAGVERKATCRALFSKLLYLAEYDGLLPQDTELAQQTNVPDVFGATTDDTAGLRIVSLYEVDMDKLEGQFDPEDAEGDT